MGRRTFKNEEGLAKEWAWNGPSLKREGETWRSIALFTVEAETAIAQGAESGAFRWYFSTDHVRRQLERNLGDIQTIFAAKAKKRGYANLRLAGSRYRAYVILYTTPQNQYVTWSWWLTPEIGLNYELGGTFPD